jgi:TolB-like protein
MYKTTTFLLFLFLSFASASDIIAVNNLKTTGLTENEALSLSDALRSEIGKTGKFQVMERSQMAEILKEQMFQSSGACDETSCAVEIGKQLSVPYVVLGNIGRVGKTYTLNVRLVEVGSGKIIRDFTEYHKGNSDELLTKVVPKVVQKIVGKHNSKKSRAVWWIAGGAVAGAAAIAVPVILLTRKPLDNGSGASDITIQWN